MPSSRRDDPRRRIPAVDRILGEPALEPVTALYGRDVVRVQAGYVLDRVREELTPPPVVGYVRDDRVILDLRTVDPVNDDDLLAAVRRAVAHSAPVRGGRGAGSRGG